MTKNHDANPEGSRTDAALIDRIVEAMRRVLVTHEHESAMALWMENAVDNFTDSETAVDNYTEAAQWSSDAEKVARELLAKYDASRNGPDAQVGAIGLHALHAEPVAWRLQDGHSVVLYDNPEDAQRDAERARPHSMFVLVDPLYAAPQPTYDAAQSERIAALEKDAARYRWLRAQQESIWRKFPTHLYGSRELDAAIDAARSSGIERIEPESPLDGASHE